MKMLKISFMMAGLAMGSLSLQATKIWVENKTDNPLKIRFSGSGIPGAVPSLVEKVGKGSVRWGDNIFGLKLEWFSINGAEVKIPKEQQKGSHWYIYIAKRPGDLTRYTLYKIDTDKVFSMHGGGLALRIFSDIAYLGLTEIAWTYDDAEHIKNSMEKALKYVTGGIIDAKGNVQTRYDEKYVVNATSLPITVQVTTSDNQTITDEVPAQKGKFFSSVKSMTSLALTNNQYGTTSIAGDWLKNKTYFAIVNGNPYQIASFSTMEVEKINLFKSMANQLKEFFKKTGKEIALSMNVKYFINASKDPLYIEMKAYDGTVQSLVLEAEKFGMLVSPSKITDIMIRGGGKELPIDLTAVGKYAGFYFTGLTTAEVLFIESPEFKFPIETKDLLWKILEK